MIPENLPMTRLGAGYPVASGLVLGLMLELLGRRTGSVVVVFVKTDFATCGAGVGPG